MSACVLPLPSGKSSLILTAEAVEFLAFLHRKFNRTRVRLLKERTERQKRISAGEKPTFLPETAGVRAAEWRVASCPADLAVRHVEITGPAAPAKMVRNLSPSVRGFQDFRCVCLCVAHTRPSKLCLLFILDFSHRFGFSRYVGNQCSQLRYGPS